MLLFSNAKNIALRLGHIIMQSMLLIMLIENYSGNTGYEFRE